MAADRKYLYVVMMDVEPEVEADFNRVYDEEHVPGILKVPGVLGASRYETSTEGQPKYLALYEVEGPDVPGSDAFRKAADSGEWPTNPPPHQEPPPHRLQAYLALVYNPTNSRLRR